MKNDSNLFYTCSLIEYIGREKKQRRSAVVNYLGKNTIKGIYNYADVFHCDPIEKVADEFIEISTHRRIHLTMLENADIRSRTIGQLVRVYERLIEGFARENE